MMSKYDILLKFVNRLLEKMGKVQVEDVVEFKGIRREELQDEGLLQVYEEMSEEIHKYYSKYNLKCAQQKIIKTYLLTILKSMASEVFLKVSSTTISKRVGKKVVGYIEYSISTADEQ
jgi:hypothetical protein